MVLYYWTVGFPIAIIALILELISYKEQKNKLALYSVVIDILPFLYLIFILIL